MRDGSLTGDKQYFLVLDQSGGRSVRGRSRGVCPLYDGNHGKGNASLGFSQDCVLTGTASSELVIAAVWSPTLASVTRCR